MISIPQSDFQVRSSIMELSQSRSSSEPQQYIDNWDQHGSIHDFEQNLYQKIQSRDQTLEITFTYFNLPSRATTASL